MWEAKANQDGLGSLLPWKAIDGVSRMAYNYFNPDAPKLVSRVPENALGAVDCVMPNTNHPELLDLNNINNGSFDANGHIVPDGCFNYLQCSANPSSANIPASDGVAGNVPTQTGASVGNTGQAMAIPIVPTAGDSTLPPPPPK